MVHVELPCLSDWREWLKANHANLTEAWLVLRKGAKGKCLTMREAIDEAICFGWIDSRSKRVDDERYEVRFTPRKDGTKWSDLNLRRAREMMDQGRMTEMGAAVLPTEFFRRLMEQDQMALEAERVPPELESALRKYQELWDKFGALPSGKRREFIRWVSQAKRPETRNRRVERTVELVLAGRSLTDEMMGRYSRT